MASVKFGTKQWNDVEQLTVVESNSKGKALLILQFYNGAVSNEPISLGNGLRIEAKNTDMYNYVETDNCATVYGDVVAAVIGNCLYVDGFIADFKSTRGSVVVDRNIKICHGKEALERQGMGQTYKQQRVLHISGHLKNLVVKMIPNARVETVIWGKIAHLEVPNCGYIKGNVQLATVGNIIKCTYGKSTASSTKKLREQREARGREFDKTFGELFNSASFNVKRS